MAILNNYSDKFENQSYLKQTHKKNLFLRDSSASQIAINIEYKITYICESDNDEKCIALLNTIYSSVIITVIISYLGMKSWDLQVCDRASTITHVDREKKNSANYSN